eukprot:CAMPEP_0178467050 /NCGR_PEP_ID=MMETSP0689_2-20121128/52217_1 /TAXON_ID=160604 /ORGANISM="Amphidinium massartii, Strain CS-259" /LENGTH=70 /DNA_ID=CAMNT_0020094089 /DNA_START=342 /DNA_END=555 /DNA_ORIENTATION=-
MSEFCTKSAADAASRAPSLQVSSLHLGRHRRLPPQGQSGHRTSNLAQAQHTHSCLGSNGVTREMSHAKCT